MPDTDFLPSGELRIDGPYDSVWDALEPDLVERERQKLLADLSIQLELYIKAQGWTQKEAAKRLGVTQPRISDLMRGRIDLFSVDALLALLWRAGLRIDLSLREAA